MGRSLPSSRTGADQACFQGVKDLDYRRDFSVSLGLGCGTNSLGVGLRIQGFLIRACCSSGIAVKGVWSVMRKCSCPAFFSVGAAAMPHLFTQLKIIVPRK